MSKKESIDDILLNNADIQDVGICIFDSCGKFVYMNDAFLKIRNVDRAFYEERTAYELFKSKLTDKCIIDIVKRSKKPISDVQNVLDENGNSILKHLVTVYPIFDENKDIKNYIAYYKNLGKFYKTNLSSKNKLDNEINDDSSVVAESMSMKELYFKAKQAANTDANILITGETGTGKEVLAKYIHNNSKRKDKPFVVVDCTSLPSTLIEAELFGYEKGSFTGATQSKPGLIEMADGGTLFIDEINSLPLDFQGKLLRTIETKVIKRVGSLKTKSIDFRLIVATNIDLLQCVQEKSFRLDLYYRVNVLTFTIPPLRTRTDDIIPLTRQFEKELKTKYNDVNGFSANLYQEMLVYNWPGNVRELKNFVERVMLLGAQDAISYMEKAGKMMKKASNDDEQSASKQSQQTLPVGFPDVDETNNIISIEKYKSSDSSEEITKIKDALLRNHNHREKTAEDLHISRRTLQYKLKKYNLL